MQIINLLVIVALLINIVFSSPLSEKEKREYAIRQVLEEEQSTLHLKGASYTELIPRNGFVQNGPFAITAEQFCIGDKKIVRKGEEWNLCACDEKSHWNLTLNKNTIYGIWKDRIGIIRFDRDEKNLLEKWFYGTPESTLWSVLEM